MNKHVLSKIRTHYPKNRLNYFSIIFLFISLLSCQLFSEDTLSNTEEFQIMKGQELARKYAYSEGINSIVVGNISYTYYLFQGKHMLKLTYNLNVREALNKLQEDANTKEYPITNGYISVLLDSWMGDGKRNAWRINADTLLVLDSKGISNLSLKCTEFGVGTVDFPTLNGTVKSNFNSILKDELIPVNHVYGVTSVYGNIKFSESNNTIDKLIRSEPQKSELYNLK